ncbi:cell wall-binding repeat-containing protein [Bifidobacterium panos]|uniref:Internalin A n=1 Tax=Bifidobacterium panos TaxID=2675321 RepID=A0ABX1SXE7_9BIFI|nr:cell wall-binding repeat-containing protein [Bifidobacterium sp. DSM 109963]NMN02495.1 internalin A [Bifidobacterium sp. DSM 109963]
MRANVRPRHNISFAGRCFATLVAATALLAALFATQTAQAATPTLAANPNTANLVLVARFSDETARNTYNETAQGSTRTRWDAMMDGFNSITATTGSFRNYIANASLGKLNVLSVFPQNQGNGAVTYLDLDIPSDQCNNNDAVMIAVESAMKKQFPDWKADPTANLERDGEDKDYIDNVMIILDTARSDMRSRKASMSGQVSIGGLRVGDFELVGYSGTASLDGTPVHEYLHARGALDLYRNDGGASDPKLATRWDIMSTAYPSLMPLAITAKDAGFIDSIDTVSSGRYTLKTYVSGERHAVAFKSPLNEDEYFVAEYRQGDVAGINGYLTDRCIGGKSYSSVNDTTYNGIIVYRVNSKYGPTGAEPSGNTQYDYVYVFRPGDQPTQDSPGGSGVGDIQNANLQTGESIGSTETSDGVADHAIVYSNGVNSRIVLDVVSMADGSATIDLKIPDYSDQSLWTTEKGPNSATSVNISSTDPSLTAAGKTLWGVLPDFNSVKVVTSTGSGWVENTTAANGMTAASATSHNTNAVLTGLSGSKILVRTQSGGSWVDKTIDGSFVSARSVSRSGGLYTLGFSQSNKSVSVYRTDGDVRQLGSAISGQYINDAIMLDGTHLAVVDFFSNALQLYTLTDNTWVLSQTISYNHRTLSSATAGGKTLLFATSSSGGKIYSFDGNKLAEATGSAPRFGDTGALSSDGAAFYMTYTATGAGNVTSVVCATSKDGVTWSQLGENVMQPAYNTSSAEVLSGKAFVLAGTSSSFQLKSHAIEDTPEPEPVKVEPPVAKSGLVYNGKSQTGVDSATGYTLSGQSATNAGSYTATATLTEGYVWSDGSSVAKKIAWSIAKAKPPYTVPSNLSGVQGGKLSSVKLPSGWAWKAPSTVLSKTGKQQYDAVYTPEDTGNYTTVAQKLTVNVTAKPTPAPVKVEPPVAKSGLVYNGKSQTGVNGATGYTLSGQTATNAGSYTATATLAKGYVWSDGSSAAKKITWSIGKAKPSYTTPSNLSAVQGSKLSDVKLPSGWTWKSPATVLSKTGSQQYDAVYTPGDTRNYTTVAQKLTVNVTAKSTSALVKVKAPTAKSGLVYNGKSQTGVNGATGYTLSGQTATNAGSYTATATLAKGYVWSDGSSGVKKIGWSIGKAKPSYTTPSNLSAVQGGKLSGVKLPSGWKWKNSDTVLSKTGKQQYDAVYTPGDTRNYTTVAQKLTVNVTAKSSSRPQLQRLAGDTRYDTMARLVATAFPKTSGTVVVANGGNYPDALSASGLAGVLGAPIVLTDSGSLSDQAAAQLKRLRPSRIVIAGGTAAISSRVESQLRGYAKSVERQAGSTRYDTSYKLYARGGKSWGTTAIVATGAHYADALSISSYAYAAKAPVFLCDPNTGLTSQQRSALNKFKRVVVVGGENAVPSRLVKGLPGLTRLSGNTRYDTSVAIAKWVQKNGLGMNGVVYATGEHFADALAAGPLAGRNKAAMLLVANPSSPTVSYSASYRGKVSKAYVAGGTSAVSTATANAIADKLNMKRP